MAYQQGSKTWWLVEAMRFALKSKTPRTAKEWAFGHGLSTVTVYRVATDENLHGAIRKHESASVGMIPNAIVKERGRRYAQIGSRLLRRAGLLNESALSYRIEHEQIILGKV